MAKSQKYFQFIGKTLYLEKPKILVIGDLHLGYEYMLRETGSLIPATQFRETKKDLKAVFLGLKEQKKKIKKVIFLGDVKHFFPFNKGEKNLFLNLLLLIGKYEDKEIIILPSFLPLVEGTSLNEYLREGSCIIPSKDIKKFNVFIVGENNVFNFGKLNKLMINR